MARTFITDVFPVCAMTVGALRAFEANKFPLTSRVAPGVAVLTPTRPDVPHMARTFTVAALRDVVPNTVGAEIALDAYTLPNTSSVEPAVVVPMPISVRGVHVAQNV
jgi:hypothetical protein